MVVVYLRPEDAECKGMCAQRPVSSAVIGCGNPTVYELITTGRTTATFLHATTV